MLSAVLSSSRLQDGGQRPRDRLPHSSHVLKLPQQLVVVARDALVLCPHHAQLAYLEQVVQLKSTDDKHFTAQDRVQTGDKPRGSIGSSQPVQSQVGAEFHTAERAGGEATSKKPEPHIHPGSKCGTGALEWHL